MIEAPSRPSQFPDDDDPRPYQPVLITEMRLEDIEHVSRLERRCYTLPWSSGAYVTEVGNPSAHYIVAKDADGTLVGYAGLWVVMDEMHVTTIAVDPDQRGRRIGERLLLMLLEEGIARGADRATLEVREHNVAAHSLYLKYGFEDVAVRKNYYSDNHENALIMWANNIVSPEYLALLEDHKRRLTEG